MTVVVDPKTGILSNDVEELLERLCGPEVVEEMIQRMRSRRQKVTVKATIR